MREGPMIGFGRFFVPFLAFDEARRIAVNIAKLLGP
jgi:hypothetical protein